MIDQKIGDLGNIIFMYFDAKDKLSKSRTKERKQIPKLTTWRMKITNVWVQGSL